MSKKRVMLVEDNQDDSELLSIHLKKEGYEVVAYRTAEAALKSIRKRSPAIVCLDMRLPGMGGLDFMRDVRQFSQVPVVVVSGMENEAQKAAALKLGADDYVTKPLPLVEVAARVESVLRRCNGGNGARHRADPERETIRIDLDRHVLSVGERSIPITATEYALLKCLADAEGKVLSREDLFVRAWEEDKSMDLDERTIDQHISRLRRKLGEARGCLVTVPKFGYRLETNAAALSAAER